MKDLHKKGFIVLGDEEIKLTSKGKKLLAELSLPVPEFNPKKWDKKWRVITYDIPEVQKKGRNALHHLLKNWDCIEIQKSVFISPFDCMQEIAIATKEYNLNRYIFYFVTSNILNESKYKQHYGIR